MNKLAKKYSKALFEASDKNNIAEIALELTAVADSLTAEESAKVFSNPRISLDEKKEIIDTEGFIKNEKINNLCKILIDKQGLELISDIATDFDKRAKHYLNNLKIIITTARTLEASEQEELTNSLMKLLDKNIKITWQENSELIGGYILQAGDYLIDNSIKGTLGQLKRELVA